MATNNNTQTPQAPATAQTPQAAPKDDRVDLYVEKGYANDEPNLIISINGKNYVLPRGKTSKVPKFVSAEYARSQRAREARDEKIDKMLEASK